jgi:hypothetical protein
MLYDPRWDSPVKQVLALARSKIEDPKHWSPKGIGVDPTMCAAQALQTASYELESVRENFDPSNCTKAYAALASAMGAPSDISPHDRGMFIGQYNDSHSHAEVMAALDRALA